MIYPLKGALNFKFYYAFRRKVVNNLESHSFLDL